MASTLLILFALADPLLGHDGIATAQVTGDAVTITLAHGHDAQLVSEAIKGKLPQTQVTAAGPVLTVKGASMSELETVTVTEPGADNMLAMEAPQAGGSIRVARAMDVPPEMIAAKVVAIGKGEAPVLRLKRGKLKDAALGKKLKPVFSARVVADAAPSGGALKVGDDVLVHVAFRKTDTGEEAVIDQIARAQ